MWPRMRAAAYGRDGSLLVCAVECSRMGLRNHLSSSMKSSEAESSSEEAAVAGRGRCVCGAVQFDVTGPLRSVIYCHCHMCRRWSGHIVAATACQADRLRLRCATTLSWYQSSAKARRGFCMVCGSSLFWMPSSGEYVAIMAGTLDAPTNLSASEHIFVADAGDYYQIHDDLIRSIGSMVSSPPNPEQGT